MFSTTLKQSVATLGVVAGLLAAAGPASAQILDGPVLAKAGPQPEAGGYLATDPSSEVDNQIRLSIGGAEAAGFVKAPANATSVSNEAVDLMNNWAKAHAKTWTDGNNQPADFGSYRQGATLGTQVGSEGVKDDVPLETVSFTIKGGPARRLRCSRACRTHPTCRTDHRAPTRRRQRRALSLLLLLCQ
jgi:hypothetical protein